MIKIRDEQKYPDGNWKIWLILAGRGFGKTTAGAYNIAQLILNDQIKCLGLIANTLFEARFLMLEKIIEFCGENVKFHHKKSITIKNTKIIIFNGNDSNTLRGYSFDYIWIDEFIKIKHPEQLLKQVYLSLRLGISKIIITTTPKDIPIITKLKTSSEIFVTNGKSYDNEILSENFKENTLSFLNTDFGQQEILGNAQKNTLWSKEDIKYAIPQNIVKYRLGIDPAVVNGVTGIILIGISSNNTYYVCGDYSTNALPDVWIEIVKNLVDHYNNLEISIEVNQGGCLLKTLLKMYNIRCKIHEVRAFSSKSQRRLPTYLLYKQNRVFHADVFPELEQELLQHSADRIDALNWSLQNIDPRFKQFEIFMVK